MYTCWEAAASGHGSTICWSFPMHQAIKFPGSMVLFNLWVLYILVVMLCIYHGSRVDWVLTRVGPIRLCLPALSMSHAHAKILLQNCYHKVALVALLQNCCDSNDSVALAAMRYEKCYNNYRKILWLLNRSVAGRAWAEKCWMVSCHRNLRLYCLK